MAASWHEVTVAGSIVLSAVTYLLDFGSNVIVLVQYWTRFTTATHQRAHNSHCDAACRYQIQTVSSYLYCMLALLAVCHTLNAVLFKLKFTALDGTPIFAAYFLPLVHLYRLLHVLWRTLSCKGIQDIRSSEMNGLYCILGSAMEGIPMLNLQFIGYQALRLEGIPVHSMSTTFKVSIAAALISAAYSGGTSVQSIARNATTFKQRLCAGIIGASFTLSATFLRCLTFTNLNVYIEGYIWMRHRNRKFHISDYISTLILIGSLVAYGLYFWLLHMPRDFSKHLRNPRHLLVALAFGYMSANLCPLYPLISQAKDANQLGSYVFRWKLFAVSLVNLSLDLAVVTVTQVLGTLPRPYLVVSSLAALGYIFSLIAYIKFDALCGPVMRSHVSIMPAADSSDMDVNDLRSQFVPLSELCILTDDAHAQKSEKPEVDAFSQHANSSFQSTYDLALCEEGNTLDCAIEGDQKHNKSAHPHNQVDLAETKGRVLLLASSPSLDRGMKITIKSHIKPFLAASASLDRYSRAYSQY